MRKWAVSEHGSHCHGCCCCCCCSYGEDGSSNNTRATRTSTREDPSSSALLFAHKQQQTLACLCIVCESVFGQFFYTLSTDRRLWRFFNCDRYSLPIYFYFISFLCFRAGVRFSMSQDLFRQIGEKLESLFQKSLALFIVHKTHGESQPANYFFGWRIFAILLENVFKKEYSVINSFLCKTKSLKNPKKSQKICHNCSKQYERVFQFFYTFIF